MRALATLLCLFATGLAARGSPDPALLRRPADWYAGPEAAAVAANILTHQTPGGGWPKGLDTFGQARDGGDRAETRATFDNGATIGELRFLGKVLSRRADPRLRTAFDRGLRHVLEAQYPSGGFPQSHPPGKGYARHITFNDGAMTGVLGLLRDVAGSPDFSFLDPASRKAAGAAFDRGIGCILRCQVRVQGKPAAWCAQHDRETLAPVSARSYELASLSGAESVGITRLLMSVDRPSPEVRASVEGAVAWFRKARIDGIRLVAEGGDLRVAADPGAPALWARFYDLKEGRPMFCDRDGVPRRSLSEIGKERRNGYDWYGSWPRALIDREYPAWKARNP